MARNSRWWLTVFVLACSTVARAEDVSISAQVDHTTVEIGNPITLTITLSGNLSDAKLPPPEFPDGFAVVARTQSTNFSIRAGVAERSTGLTFVLVPQHEGTFKLGPFKLTRGKQQLETTAIDVTVKKSALPPTLRREPQSERYTL